VGAPGGAGKHPDDGHRCPLVVRNVAGYLRHSVVSSVSSLKAVDSARGSFCAERRVQWDVEVVADWLRHEVTLRTLPEGLSDAIHMSFRCAWVSMSYLT
jgi:hypothetical protein